MKLLDLDAIRARAAGTVTSPLRQGRRDTPATEDALALLAYVHDLEQELAENDRLRDKEREEWASRRCECSASDSCKMARERDEARERVLDAALIHAELVRERDEARATAERLSMFYTGCELERRRFEDNLKDAVAQRDEAVHACAAALAERITWYQRGREEALKKP